MAERVTSILGGSSTKYLTGWGDWADMGGSVRALLFGALVERAIPIVRQYHSDLYHDAQWIAENVSGPCDFYFMARYHGTHIGPMAITAESTASGEERVLWHVALTCDERKAWHVTFTEMVRVEEAPTPIVD